MPFVAARLNYSYNNFAVRFSCFSKILLINFHEQLRSS